MSAKNLTRLLMFSRLQLVVTRRLSSTGSAGAGGYSRKGGKEAEAKKLASAGAGKGGKQAEAKKPASAGGSTQSGKGDKEAKEPKKPFEQPKTSGPPAESKGSPAPPPPAEPPFDNSQYQVQELFQHNPMSFYDIECSLSPLRCPLPSSKKPA